ncbi:MAG: hypothetical protein PHW33_00765, partial [Candidatus Portnoybacteria bacterium]|nr:hypothetical protein [Candidatus Portnoybacteria bacterium]
MKKIFLIVFFVLMIAGQGFACDYCRLPLSLKQGCDEVALRVGGQSADCRKKFLREMVTGFHQGGAAVLPPGTKFAWTVDNDGFARQTFRLSQKQDGRVYPANVCGKEIAFFYPSDNSFLFGLTIGKP